MRVVYDTTRDILFVGEVDPGNLEGEMIDSRTVLFRTKGKPVGMIALDFKQRFEARDLPWVPIGVNWEELYEKAGLETNT